MDDLTWRILQTTFIVGILLPNSTTASMSKEIHATRHGTDVPGKPLFQKYLHNAKLLKDSSPKTKNSTIDPILSDDYFEGDIILPELEPSTRNAVRNMTKIWPGGVIPYVISAAYNAYQRSVIADAFEEYNQNTCVRFVPWEEQYPDYIFIAREQGCSSSVGKIGGKQPLVLGSDCISRGIVIHELMHVLGFWHEQSRYDRDEYITIITDNIIEGKKGNFEKVERNSAQSLDLPYDTNSIMHYGKYAFSKGFDLPTILPKNSSAELGQRRGLSQMDKKKINSLYKCTEKGTLTAFSFDDFRPTVEHEGEPEKENALMKKKGLECQDHNSLCSKWLPRTSCDENSWMLVHCKKSCGLCCKRKTLATFS